MKLKINKNSKFALIGHGYHLNCLFEELIKNKFPKPIIITHKKKFHLRDIKNSENDRDLYRNVFEIENKTNIYYINDINSKIGNSILKKHKVDYIFSLSSKFIFKKEIINKFRNKIFNLHPSLLPEEKGGGTFTYRILNKKKFCAATIHILDEGVDTGKILIQSKKEKLKGNMLPIDYLKHTNLIYKSLIKNFVNTIVKNKDFKLKNQNESKGWYLPRFYTDISGAINWSWKGKDIDLFVKACSKPYPGAFCFIKYKQNDLKFTIYNSRFNKIKKFTHPWFIGKIFYEDENLIQISVIDGILIVKKQDIKLEKNVILKKNIGKTLFSYSSDLNKSLVDRTNIFKYK